MIFGFNFQVPVNLVVFGCTHSFTLACTNLQCNVLLQSKECLLLFLSFVYLFSLVFFLSVALFPMAVVVFGLSANLNDGPVDLSPSWRLFAVTIFFH